MHRVLKAAKLATCACARKISTHEPPRLNLQTPLPLQSRLSSRHKYPSSRYSVWEDSRAGFDFFCFWVVIVGHEVTMRGDACGRAERKAQTGM